MIKALVNKIIPFSSVDGGGNRTAIFLQGCNFECVYCHNPETIRICDSCGICVSTCPSGSLSQSGVDVVWRSDSCIQCDQCIKECPDFSSPKVKEMTVAEVMVEIENISMYIRGVTVSGGECMLQSDFLQNLFHEVRKKNITQTSRFLSSIDPNLPLKLIIYRPFGVKESNFSSSVPSDQLMSDLKSIAESEGVRKVQMV